MPILLSCQSISLRYGVSVHDLCSLPLSGSFFRDLLAASDFMILCFFIGIVCFFFFSTFVCVFVMYFVYDLNNTIIITYHAHMRPFV